MGGRRERVHPGAFLSIGITLPPLPEQRRIVDLIGALDEHIAALRLEEAEVSQALTAGCLEWTTPGGFGDSVLLADVCDVLDRHRVPLSEAERASRLGDVPYYGANGQVGWMDAALFDEPLVLLWEDGGPLTE